MLHCIVIDCRKIQNQQPPKNTLHVSAQEVDTDKLSRADIEKEDRVWPPLFMLPESTVRAFKKKNFLGRHSS